MTKQITSSPLDAYAEAAARRSGRSPKSSVQGGVRKKAAEGDAPTPAGRRSRAAASADKLLQTLQFLEQPYQEATFTITTPAPPRHFRSVPSEPLLITVPERYRLVGDAYLLESPTIGPVRRRRVARVVPNIPVPSIPTAVHDLSASLVAEVPEGVPLDVPAERPAALPQKPCVPTITSITPGGAAWWKVVSRDPQPLHNIYLELDQTYHHYLDKLPEGPVATQLRQATHGGRADVMYNILRSIDRKVANYVAAFERLTQPTIEQVDGVNDARVAMLIYRAHAVVHALVGVAPILDKIRMLHLLATTYPELMPAIRMMGLNLLHIACTIQATAKDRFVLVRFFKQAGVSAAGTSDTGLTPMHCLAAQADGVFSMPLLAVTGCESAFAVDINARNAAHETPLYLAYATQPNNAALIAWLRQRGAHVLMHTTRRETMLHAVLRHGDHPDVVRDLINSGLGPSNVDEAGQTAISLAKQLSRSDSQQMLIDAVRERLRSRVPRPRLGTTRSNAIPPPGPLRVPNDGS